MSWLTRWKRRLRVVVRPDAVARELDEELAFHLDMETEKNLRAGMSPAEARRRARLAFGAFEARRAEVWDARWFGWVQGLSLDFRLGMRMLAKSPGLSLVAGVAVIVATGLGAAMFEFSSIYHPKWPFPDADRVVAVQLWDRVGAEPELRTGHALGVWNEHARSFELLGGIVDRDMAVATADGRAEVVEAAQIGLEAFAIPEVPPLHGRPLLASDEAPGAARVVVLEHDLWQRLFDGDPGAIGRTIRVGAEPATVVGVMPAGFRFPFNQEAWLPLPRELLASPPLEGPRVRLLGRLARGVSPAAAETELATLMAADPAMAALPEADRYGPRVRQLTEAMFGAGTRWLVYGARVLFLLLMTGICINIATLVYARATLRGGEIAVRSALGASRKRIVTQLFIEGLVLTTVPALIGLSLAALFFPRAMALFWEVQEMTPPFWADGRVDAWTAAYVAGLTVFGAMIIGVLPALKATGKRLQPRLSQLSAGGSELRFGGIWTVIIVAQVAIAAALLPFTVMEARHAMQEVGSSGAFPAQHFLTGRLSLDEPPLPADAPSLERRMQRARLHAEVRTRLESEPGVLGAAYASKLPGMNHVYEIVEVEGVVTHEAAAGSSARRLDVDPRFLQMMGSRIVSGRPHQGGDFEAEPAAVLVNQEFVREVMSGRDPTGLRLRYVGGRREEASPWFEIAGVTSDLEMDAFGPGRHRAVYHPLRDGELGAVQLFVRLAEPDPTAGPHLLGVASAVDSGVQLAGLHTVREAWHPAHTGERWMAGVWIAVVAITLLLSMAGIHAMMAFLVTRRTREIGIRTALGAGRARVLVSVFGRALAQVGLGVAVGWGIAAPAMRHDLATDGPIVFLVVGAILLVAGVAACFLPALRALRVEPTEALRMG